MNGLHLLVGLIVFVFFLTIVVIVGTLHDSSVCEQKGGVYVSKIHRCMKKEFFIPLE